MIHCKNVGIDWSSRPSEDLPLYAHRSANFIFEGSQNVQGHQANFYQPQLKWNFVNIQNIPVFKSKPNDRKHASKGWNSDDAIIWFAFVTTASDNHILERKRGTCIFENTFPFLGFKWTHIHDKGICIHRPHHLTRSFLIPAVWYWNCRQERNFNTTYIKVDQYRPSEYSDGLSLVCIWCK